MHRHSLYIILFLFAFNSANAQTSNEGTLYIAEDTEFSTVEPFDNLTNGSFFNDGDVYIYNHFNNDGIVDFYQKTGLLRFVGSTYQNISGDEISYFQNVLFKNKSSLAPFHLSGVINIGGTSDFYEGIVDNDNYGGQFTFSTNGSHINTSDYSHVDGAVNKIGESEFTFPVGDGGYYRFAGISDPAKPTAFFETKFFFENSNTLYSHELKSGVIEEIDNREYWTIKSTGSSVENGLITLSWRDVTTPAVFIEAAKQKALTIVRWDVATNMWVDEGGAIDLDNQTVTTAVNGYGVFTFGRVKSDKILPCGLVIYNSMTPNGDGVNDYFLIDQSNNQCARNLKVEIFNRWGVKVFQTNNYGLNGDVFDGYSSGRLTVKNSDKLPTGTYYYILQYEYGDAADKNVHKKAGYLYLSAN